MVARLGSVILCLGLFLGAPASGQQITEFPLPFVAYPQHIVAGPDSNLWFTEFAGGLGRITTSGQATQVVSNSGGSTWDLAFDGEGTLWFNVPVRGKIGRLSRELVLTEFTVADEVPAALFRLAAGPEGGVWFTDGTPRIRRISADGSLSEIPLPGGLIPIALTSGPDRSLWFIESGIRIGSLTRSGQYADFPLSEAVFYGEIAFGPDGFLWFTERAGKVGRISLQGEVTKFPIARFHAQELGGIAAGPDGNMWFTEASAIVGGRGPLPTYYPNKVGRITPDGVISEAWLPNSVFALDIALGPDGNLWISEFYVNKIARVHSSPVCVRGCTTAIPFR